MVLLGCFFSSVIDFYVFLLNIIVLEREEIKKSHIGSALVLRGTNRHFGSSTC